MDNKAAYKSGNYSSQSAAMDANHFAVEGAPMEGYTLWVYCAKNDHEYGDQWNGEDLSIYSLDDKALPVSALPPAMGEIGQSTASLVKESSNQEGKLEQSGVEDGTPITPTNLRQTLTSPSISAVPSSSAPEIKNTPGYRAAEAFVRPSPVAVAGSISKYGFDLHKCEFHLEIRAAKAVQTSSDGNPTVVFLPEYHFPKDDCVIEVSSGKWEIGSDDSEGALVQRFRWWHGEGDQSLKIKGVVRTHNVREDGTGADGDVGYYQAVQTVVSQCSIM